MAKCNVCNKEMSKAAGCTSGFLVDKNKKHWEKIKVGDDREGWGYEDQERCGDCGAKVGYYHHDGCDIERCPKCNGQLLSCDCDFPEICNFPMNKIKQKNHGT